MSLKDPWMKHQIAALTFWNQGKHREAATNYWLSFRGIPNSTHEGRYHIFHGYTTTLRDNYFDPTDDDVKNMEQIFRDKHEPRLFRLEAGFTLGVIFYSRSERLKCQDYYHRAITIGEKQPKNSKQEKLEQRKMTMKTTDGGEEQKTMKVLMDGVLRDCQDNLNRLNRSTMRFASASEHDMVNKAAAGVANMSTSRDPPKKRTHVMPLGPGGTTLTETEFNNLIDVGGLHCDCCKVKAKKLLVCERCKKSYYCSAECQKKQWKNNGHKFHCRKDGEFKADDLVQIARLKSKPELNEYIVRIVGPDKHKEGRYEVRVEGAIKGNNKSVSIAAGNLNQLRP
mmetsp:Transcript_5633/g.8733  ORF Transcript_5633/g.8733 Transcript_5633/m.8733 type:complete len:339 (+) Transcript_5633:126-1142(+)